MRISVRAKPRSKKERFERIDGTNFVISVKEPPEKGQANQAIIKALAEHLNIASSRIIIVSGATSKQKIFEIRQ